MRIDMEAVALSRGALRFFPSPSPVREQTMWLGILIVFAMSLLISVGPTIHHYNRLRRRHYSRLFACASVLSVVALIAGTACCFMWGDIRELGALLNG